MPPQLSGLRLLGSSEVPSVAVEVLRVVLTLTIDVILRLRQDSGICLSGTLAMGGHGLDPYLHKDRTSVNYSYTFPRYLSSHASTVRTSIGRCSVTSCGVSSTTWLLSAAGVPSMLNIGVCDTSSGKT